MGVHKGKTKFLGIKMIDVDGNSIFVKAKKEVSEEIEAVWNAAKPTLTGIKGKIIVGSCGEAVPGSFKDLWDKSFKKENKDEI